jgi:hypothetical protein
MRVVIRAEAVDVGRAVDSEAAVVDMGAMVAVALAAVRTQLSLCRQLRCRDPTAAQCSRAAVPRTGG